MMKTPGPNQYLWAFLFVFFSAASDLQSVIALRILSDYVTVVVSHFVLNLLFFFLTHVIIFFI